MSNDIDFEQFIKLLDGALASDDKNVKQALKKFLFIAAMVMGDDCEPGPFTRMMETIDGLQRRISTLENKDTYTTATDLAWTGTTTATGTAASPSFLPSTTGSTWTSGSITSSGATSTPWTNVTGITSNTTSSPTTTTISASTTSNITSITAGAASLGATNWWVFDDNPGTNIKEDIKKSIEKLAKSS